MRDAAAEALTFIEGRNRSDLDQHRMLVLALVREIEIIGAAAAHVSAETRGEVDAIPWSAVIAMRNRLVHAYFDVDLDRVWDTLTDDLPPLIAEMEKALEEHPPTPEPGAST